MFEDTVGAFCSHGRFTLTGAKTGPLYGLRFGVKDLIDVAGYATGAGSPRWLATHPVANRNASCVDRLLSAGAIAIGKTLTDELAYSINGDNIHYGTPRNTLAPDCTPGGSSSGSAAAVAAGLCDFALATDTGGSTRIPASFCGLFGLRSTHGAIPMDGVVPLMPSFDTLTWLAREHAIFARVGDILLPPQLQQPFTNVVVLNEAVAEMDEVARAPFLSGLVELERLIGAAKWVDIAPEGLETWRLIYRDASAYESWQVHSAWIEATQPDFSPTIASRFVYASTIPYPAAEAATRSRNLIRKRVHGLLAPNALAVLPTVPGAPVRLDAAPAEIETFRQRAMRLTCIAGLASLPQVSVPGLTIAGHPFGLSLMGLPGRDRDLIALAG